jgi:putative flavoprotein involved in K+ transport
VREITALVVGGGASGLAAGASLRMAGVHDIVIVEGRSSIEGHWGSQYDSLSITSRREHCSLPHYPVPEDGRFPVELSARDFIEYLRTYAARFALQVQLSTTVKSARRQGGGWIVETSSGTYRCQHLIVASGLHNRPKFPHREAQVLSEGGGFAGQVMHSSQVIPSSFSKRDLFRQESIFPCSSL